jgi:hypothetical protein
MEESPQLSPEELTLFKLVEWYDYLNGQLELSTPEKTIKYDGERAVQTLQRFEWWRKNQRWLQVYGFAGYLR